jgi:hypothetical protein
MEAVLRTTTTVHDASFFLIWHPWRPTSLTSAGAFHFRVLIGMQRFPFGVGVPLHRARLAW